MSIWSRSHNDLAKLAKALKDRNAQTRQGLAERGRTSTWQGPQLAKTAVMTGDENSAPSPSQNSVQLDVPCSPEKPSSISCDKLVNLLDLAQRARADSFSSADSAISPDFHGCSQSPLSPILKRSIRTCYASESLRNTSEISKVREKKVTFSQDGEEVRPAVPQKAVSGVTSHNNHIESFVDIDTPIPIIHDIDHEIPNSQSVSIHNTQHRGEEEPEVDLSEVECVRSPNFVENEGESRLLSEGSLQQDKTGSSESVELPSMPYNVTNSTSSVPLPNQSNEFDHRTVDDGTSTTPLSSSILLSPSVLPESHNEESSFPVSSLNLSNELNTLLISVLADHKRQQNLRREEVISHEKLENDDKSTDSISEEFALTDDSKFHNTLLEQCVAPSCASDQTAFEDVDGTGVSHSTFFPTPNICQNAYSLPGSESNELTGNKNIKETGFKRPISLCQVKNSEKETTPSPVIDVQPDDVSGKGESSNSQTFHHESTNEPPVSSLEKMSSSAHFGTSCGASTNPTDGSTLSLALKQTLGHESADKAKQSPCFVSHDHSNAPNVDELSTSANVASLKCAQDGDRKTRHLLKRPQTLYSSIGFSNGFNGKKPVSTFLRSYSSPNLLQPSSKLQENIHRATYDLRFHQALSNSTSSPQRTSPYHNYNSFKPGMYVNTTESRPKLSTSMPVPINSSHNEHLSLQRSRHPRNLTDSHKADYSRSFYSAIGQAASLKTNYFERSFDFSGFNRDGGCNHVYPTQSFVSPEPDLLCFESKTSNSSEQSEFSLSLEEDSSVAFSDASVNHGNDVDCVEETGTARLGDEQREWYKSLGSKVSLASVPNLDTLGHSGTGAAALAESAPTETVGEYPEEGPQPQNAHEVSNFHNSEHVSNSHNVGVVSKNPPFSKSSLDFGPDSCSDGPTDDDVMKKCYLGNEEQDYEVEQLQNIPEKLVESVEQEHERKESPFLTSKPGMTEFDQNCVQNCDTCSQDENTINPKKIFSNSKDGFYSPSRTYQFNVPFDSTHGSSEKYDDSLLHSSLDISNSTAKTKPSNYQAQVGRINNFSQFLLAQFPDNSTHKQNATARKDLNSSGDASSSFNYEIHAPKFQETACSSAQSAVLLNIMKAVQLLNGLHCQTKSHSSYNDGSNHFKRRGSITKKEMKGVLRQLKDSHDFLTHHPTHELQAVRDDLQQLSSALRHQICRSKTNLDRDLQHRNAAYQGRSLNNHSRTSSGKNLENGEAIHRGIGGPSDKAQARPRAKRVTISRNVSREVENNSRAVDDEAHLVLDEIYSRSFVSGCSTHENHGSVTTPEVILGRGKGETTKEILNGHDPERYNSDQNSWSPGSFQSDSESETRHREKHMSPNPFKEMYKFMCDEINMSAVDGDCSKDNVRTDHVDLHDTAQETRSLCTENTSTSSPCGALEHNPSPQHPQQHIQHRKRSQKLYTHPKDTSHEQNPIKRVTLQDLNKTFCLQESPPLTTEPQETSEIPPPLDINPQDHQQGICDAQDSPLSADDLEETRVNTSPPSTPGDASLHRTLHQPQHRPTQSISRLRQQQQQPPASMESDSELTFQLDRDFDKHLADMKPHVLKLPQKSERQKSAVWIKKLCEPAGSSITARQNRNMYAKLMLHMLRKGSLHSPFDHKPSDGPLQPLPSYMSIYFDDPLTDMSPQAERLPDWVEGELGESIGSSGVPRSLGNPTATSTWVSSRERPHSSMGHTLEKDPSLSPIRNTDLGRSRGYSADDMSLEVLPSPAKSALKQQKRLHQFPPLPNKEKRHLPDVKQPKPSEEHHVKDLNDTDWSKPFGTSMISNFSLPKGTSLHDDVGHSKPSDREVAVRTKMIEAKFHEEKLKLQQRHDAAVQKIIDRKNTEIEDMKAHYKSKSKEMEDTINKLERKVQTLMKETEYIRQTKDKQISELKAMSEESNETRRSDFEKKLHDVMTEFEQEKFDLQKQHTQNIQEILDDTNGRLQRMEAEYSQQTTSTTNVIKELESRVQQLMTEVDSTLSQRSAVEKEKNDALVKCERLSAEQERLKDRLSQVEKEHAIALESHEHELRTLKNKTEASLEFLKQEHSMAASKASDTISELEDKVDQLKKSLKDTEEHRHRQIRELEQGHQQDKVHLENLHDKQVRNMKKEMEQLDSDWSKKLAKAEQQTKDREQEISKLKEQKQHQAMQAEQALEEFKGQVEKNQARIHDDMKQQMQKVESDLQKSKQAREKQAKEFARQLEEEKYRHQHEIAEIKMAGEGEKSQMLRELHVQKEYMLTEQERETESLKDIHKTEILALEARLREKTDKAEKAQSDSERLIRELREELVQANQLRKQQLVELGLLREEEKQKMTRDHEAELSRIRGDSEQQRLELQKSHSAEMEKVMEKTNDRLKNIEKEYTERGHKSAESMTELQAIVTQLRGDIKRSRENSDEKLAELKQQYEEEKKSLRKQYSQNLGTIQRELESQRNKARSAEVQLQQQESDHEDKLTQLQLQFEQKMRGLLPADLKQELEDTIASLRSQVSSLQQRSLLLQEELDDSMSKHNGSLLSYSSPPITSAV